GVAAAADQLHRLHDELDFANPARAELDVLGELAARHVAPHFGVERAHRGERGVVEVLAEYEGPHHGIERGAAGTGERARLEPGVALPFAPVGDQVALERVEIAGEGAGIAERPQAHVDAEYEPVLGLFRQQADQLPAGVLVARVGRAVVKEHQIDIGGNVELTATQLPHAHHHQVFAADELEPRLDRDLGEVAHRAAYLAEAGAARQVARHHA